MRKLAATLLLGLAVAGCSSNGKSTSSSSTASTATAPVSLPGATNDKGSGDATGGKLTVTLTDFAISPTFIKVTPGESVTLTVKNAGTVPHTFTSSALGVDEEVQPGQSADVNLTAPGVLPVEVHCRFHQGRGMQGALFDVAGTSASSGAATSSASTASSSATDTTYPYN